jgi:hypothetical protein
MHTGADASLIRSDQFMALVNRSGLLELKVLAMRVIFFVSNAGDRSPHRAWQVSKVVGT